MEKKWNLDDLYKSFEDKSFINDIDEMKKKLKGLREYPLLERNEENLVCYLKDESELNDYMEKLFAYVSLTMNADTTNHQAIQYYSMLENILANEADVRSQIEKWISGIEFERYENDYIQEHLFYLNEIRENQQYLLDDASEKVLAAMKTTGSSAWSKYKDQLISSMNIVIDNKEYPLTEVLNMAYSKDKDIRKKAYEAEVKAYIDVENGIASALNAIKGEALTIVKLRGYPSVLDRTLIDSRMSRKTLEALLETVKKALPLFEKYFLLKAKYLGYSKGLPWYDIYAPIIETNSHYPYEKGCDFVVKQFNHFSKNLGDYAKIAIENEWIDVYPRKGKVGGAFCHNLHCIKESRFLLNYGNEFSDVITMAHELGHGFHGHCLNEQRTLNSDYPMPIAETASTFCETIVKKAALKEASKEEQLMILENELSDCAQVIVDIYSRFLFESRFIEKRKNGPLSVDEIKDLMIDAQKEAYLNGLDHDVLHPYMWTWKPHYYEVDYAFYNFPYAFGLLLSKGLYGMYLKEGSSFCEKYEKLLSITGKMSIEDIGKEVGIDLTSINFWQNSIDMIEEDMKLFEKLLKEIEK